MIQSSCLSLQQSFSPNQVEMNIREMQHYDSVRPLYGQVRRKHYNLNTSQRKKASTYCSLKFLRLACTSKRFENTSIRKGKILERCSSIKATQDYPSNLNDKDSTSFFNILCTKLNALYMFSRPHTVFGTVIGITSVSILPIQGFADLSPTFFTGLFKAIVPSVLMNVYVVGLNQLFDVEIDKINKPNLPLARGDFSMGTGVAIVASFLLMSLAMGMKFQSPPLLFALGISCLLGSVYSIELPLLRWKRHAFLAATCIFIVRAVVVQLAFFVHMQKYVLGKPITITKSLMFGVAFMCFFSTVIALFKDIPDVEGDRYFGIQSFSVNLGKERVFWLCVNMLLTAYGAAVVIGASSSSSFLAPKLVIVGGHLTLACLLWLRARSIDLTSKASVTAFYMFIWKLFYTEYLLIPFIR